MLTTESWAAEVRSWPCPQCDTYSCILMHQRDTYYSCTSVCWQESEVRLRVCLSNKAVPGNPTEEGRSPSFCFVSFLATHLSPVTCRWSIVSEPTAQTFVETEWLPELCAASPIACRSLASGHSHVLLVHARFAAGVFLDCMLRFLAIVSLVHVASASKHSILCEELAVAFSFEMWFP